MASFEAPFAAAVADDENIASLIADPTVNNERLHTLLIDICESKMPEGGDNFLKLLVQNGRVDSLPGIASQFAELVDAERKTVTAQVVSAQELTDAQRNDLLSALEVRLGRSISLSESVDGSLMGGAIVQAGDLVIDGSAAGKLEKLAGALAR